jgi:hypothetical protein
MRHEGKIRRLECCCCGGDAGRWHQHWNRDTGYGICMKCIDYCKGHGMDADEIKGSYGIEGVNFGEGSLSRKIDNGA